MTRYANPVTLPVAGYKPQHFRLCVEAGIATVTLERPEKKNPLHLRQLSRAHRFLPCAGA